MVDIVNQDGEIVEPADVEYAYTRDGRRTVGKEYPNPIPMEAPLGTVPYEDIWVTIRKMVLDHARMEKERSDGEEFDTEEEANDFDVGDDFDPASPWEEHHEPTDPWPQSRAAMELEARIREHRNGGRIDQLRAELSALEEGREWPPKSDSQVEVQSQTLEVTNQAGKKVGEVKPKASDG